MATWPVTTVNSPLGLQPDQETVRVINRTGSGVVVGEVVMFDLASTITEVTDLNNGSTGIFGNVITPAGDADTNLPYGLFAVCTEVAADNAEVEVVVRGKVQALVGDSGAAGEGLVAQNGEIDLTPLDTVADGNQKIIAICLETASSNPQLRYVLFDGIHGFGMNQDS